MRWLYPVVAAVADNEETSLPVSLEKEILDILSRPDEDHEETINRLCDRHPEFADTVRRRLRVAAALADEVIRSTQPSPVGEVLDAVVEAGKMPEQIGPYRILSVLGEGGFGVVYLGERREDFQKRVAVKVIKLGMDTEQFLRRFELERQALALMEHDNIAKVLDAGMTQEGRPYFVMEFVRGEPITQYCDNNKLGVDQRLEVFIKVCAGVQHAHQKGVIHRDLTPNNVLVTVQDKEPVPKIIDFGLARATDHRLVENTVYTEVGRFIGTPEYMSPEQASYGKLDIDARTDVYSLGVLLYELLTGSPPLKRTPSDQLGELRRRILEDVPQKPSTKITSEEDSASVAKTRGADPHTLARGLRGDLDWIVMRALQKDRTLRYATPSALADDVRRHLNNEPVEAGPPSLGYHIGKLIRRHRGGFAAAAAMLVILVAGIVSTSIFWAREAKARERETEAREDYENLLVGARIDGLEHRASKAHPAWPAQTGELQALVAEAEDLVAQMQTFEEVMDDLSRGHVLAGPGPRPLDRGSHPEAWLLVEIDVTLTALRWDLKVPVISEADKKPAREKQQALLKQRAAIEARVAESNRVAIPRGEARFLFDRLEHQLAQLRIVRDELMPDLRSRLAWSQKIEQESIQANQDLWDKAKDRVAKNKQRYKGLDLKAQLGLVPLGPDPESKLEEFAHLGSGEIPRRGAKGALQLGPQHGLVFVLVPEGPLQAGVDSTTPKQERTRQKVIQIPAAFVSKFEMNRAQWQRLASGVRGLRLYEDAMADLRNLSTGQNQKPANGVTWRQCQTLMKRWGLQLPSEHLWEYACKAGTTTRWYTGDHLKTLTGAANCKDGRYFNRPKGEIVLFVDTFRVLVPVHARLSPNRFGLLHMHGNVAEWCSDHPWGQPRLRIIRGGSFAESPHWAMSTASDKAIPTDAARGVGLRPVRSVDK